MAQQQREQVSVAQQLTSSPAQSKEEVLNRLCIIFDAFRTTQNESYIPKKCSIFDINTGSLTTYYICPPHSWEQLHVVAREVNSFIARYILGIGWYDGNVTYDHFIMELVKQSERATQIFTKGSYSASFLTQLLGRSVIDLEPLLIEIPDAVKINLRCKVPIMNCAYVNHKRRFFLEGFTDLPYTCCQNRAYWYGMLMQYYINHTPAAALHKQMYEKRKQLSIVINRATQHSERLI